MITKKHQNYSGALLEELPVNYYFLARQRVDFVAMLAGQAWKTQRASGSSRTLVAVTEITISIKNTPSCDEVLLMEELPVTATGSDWLHVGVLQAYFTLIVSLVTLTRCERNISVLQSKSLNRM